MAKQMIPPAIQQALNAEGVIYFPAGHIAEHAAELNVQGVVAQSTAINGHLCYDCSLSIAHDRKTYQTRKCITGSRNQTAQISVSAGGI